jgi:hypothetical protein
MRVLGVAKTESDIEIVETKLKSAGLYDRYESQIRGQQPSLIVVSVRTVIEKEQVRGIFEGAGVTEIFYQEEISAGK